MKRLLLILALLPWAGAWAQPQGEAITLNLKDADIVEVIQMVSDVTGRNFVVDQRVRARVTVISAQPLSPDALYETFLSLLQVHGFAAVTSGSVTRIVPDATARHIGSGELTAPFSQPDDELVTQVIAVENVPVAQLVGVLRPLLPQFGSVAAFPPTNMLIVSDRAGNVDRVVAIVRRIDRAGDDAVEVVRLDYASAAEMSRLLERLLNGQQLGEGLAAPGVVADERSNSLLLSGSPAQRLRLRALIAHLDTPLDAEGATQVIYLSYANAESVAEILRGHAEGQAAAEGSADRGARDQVTILADPATNSLVISAPPSSMRNLRSIIEQLDIRRAQVLVEAIIVEVTADRSAEFGVQWAVDPRDGGNDAAAVVNFNRGGNGILQMAQNPNGITPPDGLMLGVGRIRAGSTSFGALLSALAGDVNSNILSTPSLMTMDNEEAEINVGQTVPFLSGQFSGTGSVPGQVNPFQTINREDVGLRLRITPTINEGDAVQLTIEQEVSSLSAAPTGAVDLVTNKREIRTRVIVEDGDIIVLGGLMDETLQESQERVPILGSIPILGHAFRYQRTQSVKRTLMVFLRPRIMRDAETANWHTNERYRRMQDLQRSLQERPVPLMPDLDRPQVPDPGDGERPPEP